MNDEREGIKEVPQKEYSARGQFFFISQYNTKKDIAKSSFDVLSFISTSMGESLKTVCKLIKVARS